MVEKADLPILKRLPGSELTRLSKRDELLLHLCLIAFGSEHEEDVLKLLDEANREWLNLQDKG